VSILQPVQIPVTEGFITDLVLQRTGPFLKLGGSAALNQWFTTGDRAPLFGFLQRGGLVDTYLQQVLAEVETEAAAIVAMIPVERFRRLVSIGPGNGLLELALLRRASVEALLLIDIEQTGDHHHGYHATGSGYASLAETRAFLQANLSACPPVITCNPRLSALPEFPFDLLISILSMGFHYPCDGYAQFILGNGLDDAHLVIDKRRNAPDTGFEHLLSGFQVTAATSLPKHERVVLRRSAER
jgi:hypothetical protein